MTLQRVSPVAGLLVLLAAASCAMHPRLQHEPDPVPAVERTAEPALDTAAIERLYNDLAQAEDEYLAGLDLIVANEEILGEQRVGAADRSLHEGAIACADLEGCDPERWLSTMDRLLARQNLVLKSQAVRIRNLETAAAEEAELEREPGTAPFVSEIPEVDRSLQLLRGTELRDIIELNGAVNAAIDDWLTWMRPVLMQAYDNYQYLRPSMAPVYEEAGLPEALLFAMVATESRGKVHAYSRAGAAGPLQFMRHTGRRYGLGTEDGFDMRLDPEAATRANVAYLNDQFKAFNDSLAKALAAYNGGENRMRSLDRRNRGASFWDGNVFYSFPRETREYVPRVLAAAWLFLHPEDYALEFPRREVEIARLELQQEIALNELAVCLGQADEQQRGWFRTLRNLNPRLEPGKRQEAGQFIGVPSFLVPAYEERCLEGPVIARARVLHEANYPEAPPMIPYRVKRGDTLGRIASRHRCVSIQELAAINSIRPPRYMIREGQTLKIPTCS